VVVAVAVLVTIDGSYTNGERGFVRRIGLQMNNKDPFSWCHECISKMCDKKKKIFS
jgi:hypothetical protein